MAEVTLPFLGTGSISNNTINPSVRRVQDIASRSEAFSHAMDRQNPGAENIANSGGVSPIGNKNTVPPIQEQANVIDNQVRARRALDLDGAKATSLPTAGDAILGGMQKIRGIFDVREHQISRVQTSNLVDTQTLIEMQKEVVQYTMLLDITSKLTGKASQVVDQLMKGQ